jgi:hypothetical protein
MLEAKKMTNTFLASNEYKKSKIIKMEKMKKKVAPFYVFLLIGLFLGSCQSTNKEQQLSEKENELLRRENELLKKEKGNRDSLNNEQTENSKTFVIDKKIVRDAFLKYLPDIADGRKLNSFWKTDDGNGYKILIGDLNGDNLFDGIVSYSLEPTLDDNGGGGNAISEIPGIVVFLNTGKNITIADHTEDFGGARNELKKISNGVIILEGLDYADDDARCCPTLKTQTKIVLRNNKLTELK